LEQYLHFAFNHFFVDHLFHPNRTMPLMLRQIGNDDPHDRTRFIAPAEGGSGAP
jgi:hypothetical protein